MNPQPALLCVLLTLLCPALGWGQAGLFWDNSEKVRTSGSTGWDSGNRGTSALGQLESLTGQKVDTSRSTTSPRPVATRPKVVKQPVLTMNQQVGLMLFESLFQQVLTDGLSSPNQAASAEALRQQQLAAELKRQEQLRKARLLHSQWRAEWDARDDATTEQLAGVFSPVSSGSSPTSFFGIPGGVNPRDLLQDVDLFANDSSVVDLRGASSLTVPLLNAPAPGRRGAGADWQAQPAASPESAAARDPLAWLPKPAQWAGNWYLQQLPGIGWQLLAARFPVLGQALDKLESLPGAGTALDLYEKYQEFTELRAGLSGLNQQTMAVAFGGARDLVAGRGDPNAYWALFQQRAQAHRDDAHERIASDLASRLTDSLEADEVDDYQSSVTPLADVGPHPDTARWQFHKLQQWSL